MNFKKISTCLLIIIIIVSALIRFNYIRTLEIEKDEVNFFHAALDTRFRDIFTGNYWLKDHPGLYLVLGRTVVIYTTNIFHLRLINFASFLLTLYFLYLIGGWLLPAIFSSSFYFFYINLYANPYSLALFFMTASFYFFLKRKVLFFAVFSALLLYTSYVFFIYIACILLFTAIQFFKKKILDKVLLRGIVLTFIFGSYQLFLFIKNVAAFTNFTPPVKTNISQVMATLVTSNFSFLARAPFLILIFVFFLIIFLSLYTVKKSKDNSTKNFALISLLFIISPLIIMYFLNYLFAYHLTARLFILSALGMVYTVWAFFLINKNVFLKFLGVIVLIVTLAFSYFSNIKKLNKGPINYHSLTDKLLKICDKNSLFIVNSAFYDYYPLAYYYLSEYDKPVEKRHENESMCVFKNVVIFDAATGEKAFTKKFENSDIKKIYFVYFTKEIFNKNIYKYISECRKKKCEYIIPSRY